MAVKIRAKQSLSGNEYGKLRTGEIGYVKPHTAKQLVEWGMADIVAENVEAPVKEVKPFLTMAGYEPKEESKPVLYGEPGLELSDEFLAKNKDEGSKEPIPEPEKAASKKEFTEEERAEQKKKQYK